MDDGDDGKIIFERRDRVYLAISHADCIPQICAFEFDVNEHVVVVASNDCL